MPEREIGVKVWEWLAGIAAALGMTSLAGLFRMRDKGRDHDLRIKNLEEVRLKGLEDWVKELNAEVTRTREIAIETSSTVRTVLVTAQSIQRDLKKCPAVRGDTDG